MVLPAGTDRAVLDRLHQATGVTHRHLALPLDDYPGLGGFGAANDAFIEVGHELGARAVGDALAMAGLEPTDVDLHGHDVGDRHRGAEPGRAAGAGAGPAPGRPAGCRCSGSAASPGAAGVARVHDYLRGDPDASRCCCRWSCAR